MKKTPSRFAIPVGLALGLTTGVSAQWCPGPEGFEGGIGQWFADNGVWQVGPPTSGPNAAHTGNNVAATVLGGDYPPDTDSRFISPSCIVPPADQNPRLRFWHWFSFSCSDSGRVQIRETGSAEWIDASSVFTSNSGVWTESLVDLRAFATKTVEIAFYFVAVNAPEHICGGPDVAAGWYVDDVRLVTGQDVLPNPDGFEAGLGDWWVDGGVWQVGQPTSGPNAAYAGISVAATMLEGDYPSSQEARLISPRFTAPPADQNPRLRFWHWFRFSCSDSGRVQIRETGSPEWIDASSVFTSNSGVWTETLVDLRAFAAKTVEIAFYFVAVDAPEHICGGPDVAAGWYIDDVRLVTGPEVLPNPEGFEESLGDWWVDGGVWQVGQPTSGPNAARTGNSLAATVLDGDYPADQQARLISPRFMVSPADQNPRLRFWHWFSFSCSDNGRVQVRCAPAGPWRDLSSVLHNTSPLWTESHVDLRAYAGEEIEIAFSFNSVNTPEHICGGPDVAAGWYIDDVGLVTGPEVLPNPEDFEAGLGDWWVDGGVWQVGQPTSGPNAAHTGVRAAGTVLDGDYPPDQQARLISPRFVVASPPASTNLCFWHWFNFNCADSGRVQIRKAEAEWEDLGQSDFVQDSGGWTKFCDSLAPYAGKPVQIAFRFNAENTPEHICGGLDVAAGWYIDGIELPVELGPASYPVVRPGDCNSDGEVNITDPICLLTFLFLGAQEPLPCGTGGVDEPGNVALLDGNDDGVVNLTDAVASLSWLFLGTCIHPLGTECIPIDTCTESCP